MSRVGSAKFGTFGDFGSSASLNGKIASTTSTKNNIPVDSNDYVPKRFGLKYNPPTIIVEYLVPSSGKLYHHKIKISQLRADSDTQNTLDSLKKKHSVYFGGNKISHNQMIDFIERLKKRLPANSNAGTFLTNGMVGENKKESGALFGKLLPMTSSSTTVKPMNNLGSFDINKSKAAPSPLNSKAGSGEKAKNGGSNNFWAFDDLEDFEEEEETTKMDYNSTNLNKLSQEELQKHKNKMDVLFNKNQKKPGDAGFIYDKQQEFMPSVDNDWDEEF